MADDIETPADGDDLPEQTGGTVPGQFGETPPVDADKAATPAVDATVDEQFPQHVPVPVDVTDKIYTAMREEFNEDEAASLQRAWGDHAWGNEQVVRAVIRDHPAIDSIYVQNQTETGGLSADGVEHALRYLLEQAKESETEFLKKHPELEGIYFDHADENGNLSVTGAYRALHYLGKAKGYKFNYKGQR